MYVLSNFPRLEWPRHNCYIMVDATIGSALFDEFETAEAMELPAPIVYLGACLGVAGGFYGLFAAAEDAIAKSKRDSIAKLVRKAQFDDIKFNWKSTFGDIFDGVFSDKHWSWRCFWRSSLSSLLAVIALTLVWVSTDPVGVENTTKWLTKPEVVLILLSPVIFNLLPDYLSLLETRFVLKKLGGPGHNFAFIVLDLVFTFLIATVTFFLGVFILSSLEDGRLDWTSFILSSEVFFSEVLVFRSRVIDIPISVFFYSTFLTSIWIWLYICGVGVLRALQTLGRSTRFLHAVLDIDKKPLKSIGFVTMILIVGLFALAAPAVL